MKKLLKSLSAVLLLCILLSSVAIVTSASDAVAKIGDTEYDSLQEAWNVALAAEGDVTITLLSDLTLALQPLNWAVLDHNLTLDLGWHTVTSTSSTPLFQVASSKLTVKNGNIETVQTAFKMIGGAAELELENLIIRKSAADNNPGIYVTAAKSLTANNVEVYAQRCAYVESADNMTLNANGLILNASAAEGTYNNAFRIGPTLLSGTFNFTDCIFTSTGKGRTIECGLGVANVAANSLGTPGEQFESELVSTDASTGAETYKVTANRAATFNLYNCSVINYPDTLSCDMIIKTGVSTWNLYGGFYHAASSAKLFSNTANYAQGYAVMNLHAYEAPDGKTYLPAFSANPTDDAQTKHLYISNFYDVETTYTVTDGVYSPFTSSATAKSGATVYESATNGDYKYIVVPDGVSYSAFETPVDPKAAAARIGSAYYETLDAAISASDEGDTVVLLKAASGVHPSKPCKINTNSYTLEFDSDAPYAATAIGKDIVYAEKTESLTLNYWSSADALVGQDTTGLVYTTVVSVKSSEDRDFTSGYCTVDLSYTSGSDIYDHTGWSEYSNDGVTYNFVPIFTKRPDLFVVKSASGSVIKSGKTAEEFQEEMTAPTEAGETITLLGDVAVPSDNQAISASGKPYPLDLNGYKLSLASGSGKAMYKTYNPIDLTITTSRAGAVIDNVYNGKSGQMFWGAGGSSGKVTIDGDITVYTAVMFAYTGSGDLDMTLNGGNYIMSFANSSAMFVITGDCTGTVTVNDATVSSKYNYLVNLGKSSESTAVHEVIFNNSTIVTGGKEILNLSSMTYFTNTSVQFNACNISAAFNSHSALKVYLNKDCLLDRSEVAGVTFENYLTAIDPITIGDVTYTYSTSAKSDLAKIVWTKDGTSSTTYADVRDDDVSYNSSSTDSYIKTTYKGECTEQLEKGGVYNVEIEKLVEVCVEGIKYNLTLASNMDVNIAIPSGAYKKLSATYLGKKLEGKFTVIGMAEYYVVSVKDMNAVSTSESITVNLNCDGAISQSVTVKISEYAYALMNEGSTSEARELGRAILRYSYESYKALAPTDTDAISELEDMLYATSKPADESFAVGDTTALAKYFAGARLRLDSTPGIVFTLADSLDALDCEISYTDANGNVVSNSFSLTKDNREAVISGIKVYEFDSDITVTVAGDEPMTYNLETYLASGSITNGFAQAIHHYVEAAKAYIEISKVYYDITKFTLKGEDIAGAVIVTDLSNESLSEAASILRSAIFSYTGIFLEIEDESSTAARKLIVALTSDAGEDNFRVSVTGGNLVFECEYIDYIEKGVLMFVYDVIVEAEGELDFGENYLYEGNARYVRYSEFGASGDGVTDDFDEIILTHAYANSNGLRVEADFGASYYIGDSRRTAYIKTDTNWRNARFTIDDRNVPREDRYYWIFEVDPDLQPYNVSVPSGMSIMRTDTNIGLTFDTDVLLLVTNANHKVYIRYGSNVNSGTAQREMILVDKNGNIDPNTPPIFDYGEVTSIKAYSVNETPVTIEGGVFTTRSNQVYTDTFYYRGIAVNRSNTTVRNVVHYMSDEPDPSLYPSGACSYYGFYFVEYANNVTFDSCVMTGHKTYYEVQSSGNYGTKGNYDVVANHSNNVLWKNCTQTNDLNDKQFWGVMASNYCKNLAWDGCALSRFDAHCGVYNVSLKNSQVGEVINLVGSGTAYFENVTRSSGRNAYFISLRGDYGSTWEGDVIIKDCKLVVSNSASTAYLITGAWYEHWFGYKCYLPNLDVDGFKVARLNGNAYTGNFYLYKNIASSYSGDLRENATNPLGAPTSIKLKGISYTDILQGTNNDVILTDTVITKED
ncbi:MAG: hypothetical protein IJY65_02785 [Clostridia bacterium]|nr:hypothetical protein [Clostridia bacterium]